MMKFKIIAGAIVAFATGLAAYGWHVAFALQMSPSLALSFELDNVYKNILYYGSLAPSSHNAQMWQLQYNPVQKKFSLFIDPARTLPAADPHNREAYISLGAFLENVRQASAIYGYTAQIDIEENGIEQSFSQEDAKGVSSVIANIHFVSTNSTVPQVIGTPERLNVMSTRHSDKRAFEDKAIADGVLSQLLQSFPVGLHYYPKGSPEFAYLAANTVQAMSNQSDVQAKRLELAQWFRFSNQEALATQDGLPAEQLGITGIKKFFYYLFVNKQTVLTDKFAQQGIAMAQNQVDNCAGFFVITGEDSPAQWVRAGMQLESFWLDATELKVAIHPMSILLEEEPYRSEVRSQLGLEEQPQMILRAGLVSEYGSNYKIRRNLADFVTLAP